MVESGELETLVGRKEELGQLRTAIQKRRSLLILGPEDAGKTALIKKAISELDGSERRSCIYWTGAASGKELLAHFVARLYETGDSFVRKKVHADGATAISLNRWLHKQRACVFVGFSSPLRRKATTDSSWIIFLRQRTTWLD